MAGSSAARQRVPIGSGRSPDAISAPPTISRRSRQECPMPMAGSSAARQRACFGSRRSRVQIPAPRPPPRKRAGPSRFYVVRGNPFYLTLICPVAISRTLAQGEVSKRQYRQATIRGVAGWDRGAVEDELIRWLYVRAREAARRALGSSCDFIQSSWDGTSSPMT